MTTDLTARRALQMLENESLWDVTSRVHELLTTNSVGHAIVGGVAVCLHGYRRNTVDLDLLVRAEDAPQVQSNFEAAGFAWHAAGKEFRSRSGVPIHLVFSGQQEGPGQAARFPNPSDPRHVTLIEGLPVLSLAQLIQAKIACGLGDMRRTHKDFADVVELIAIHRLDGSFARFLHKSVRKEFRVLIKRVGGRS